MLFYSRAYIGQFDVRHANYTDEKGSVTRSIAYEGRKHPEKAMEGGQQMTTGGSAITDELRAMVGTVTEPVIHEVERGAIRRYVEAVNDPTSTTQTRTP